MKTRKKGALAMGAKIVIALIILVVFIFIAIYIMGKFSTFKLF